MVIGAILLLGLITWIILSFLRKQYFDGGRAMVIVEPRKHEKLKFVCENFDANMCKSWALYVFHGKSHRGHAEEAVSRIRGRELHLLSLDVDNLTAGEYNKLFKQYAFWEKMKAEHILVFQTDAVLCPASAYKIQDFMHFDYIGCESRGGIGRATNIWGEGLPFYGIGGLSFRKNSFQKKCILDNPEVDPSFPEDVFFSKCVEGHHKPRTAAELESFCTQTSLGGRESFGAHRPWEMDERRRDLFYAYCPPARDIKT